MKGPFVATLTNNASEIAWQMNPEGARTAPSLEEVEMAKKVKRRAWTKSDVRELKTHARQKTPAPKIARAMKRTLGATRQKAFQLGVSLDSR
jgi:hypothetical protein